MYLDPGFGSMIIQILIAAIAAAGAMLVVWRGKITGLFKKNKAAQENAEESDASAPREEV